jgi:hypothetical protein
MRIKVDCGDLFRVEQKIIERIATRAGNGDDTVARSYLEGRLIQCIVLPTLVVDEPGRQNAFENLFAKSNRHAYSLSAMRRIGCMGLVSSRRRKETAPWSERGWLSFSISESLIVAPSRQGM